MRLGADQHDATGEAVLTQRFGARAARCACADDRNDALVVRIDRRRLDRVARLTKLGARRTQRQLVAVVARAQIVARQRIVTRKLLDIAARQIETSAVPRTSNVTIRNNLSNFVFCSMLFVFQSIQFEFNSSYAIFKIRSEMRTFSCDCENLVLIFHQQYRLTVDLALFHP